MLDGIQLDLNVQTIQPNEAYILYAAVEESWDYWQEEDRGEEYDGVGFGLGRYIRHKTRAVAREKIMQGVIVDDCTLDIIRGRMDDYARKWEEKAIELNTAGANKPNFEVRVKYVLESVKRVVLEKITC